MIDPIDDAHAKIKVLRDKLSPVERMVFEQWHFSTVCGLMTAQDLMALIPHPGVLAVKRPEAFAPIGLSIFDVVCTYRGLVEQPGSSPSEEVKTAYEAAKQIYGFNKDVGAILGVDLPSID